MKDDTYTAWTWNDDMSDWVPLSYRKPWHRSHKTRYPAKVAAKKVRLLRRNGGIATARKSSEGKPDTAPKGKAFMSASEQKWSLIRQWLTGDLDANVELLYALSKVARDTSTPLYVAEGSRSLAEQWRLWALKKAGKISWPVAFPGTSNHTDRGSGSMAADVRLGALQGTPNIGDSQVRRVVMAKYGLCLPVAGEPWHVEFGNDWRA